MKRPDEVGKEFDVIGAVVNRAALESAIGTRARVSEVLNRKRALTLPMIRALSPLLDIPLGILAREYKFTQAA